MVKNSFFAYFLALVLIPICGCSTSTEKNTTEGYQLSLDEKQALGAGIVQFFADDLPNYSYDDSIQLGASGNDTKNYVIASIKSHGTVVKIEENDENIKILGRVGAGSGNMNPAGLVIVILPDSDGSTLSIRAVAKEGSIKQNTCKKATDRLIADLESSSKRKAIRWKKL